MSLSPALRERIQSIVDSERVVLFMKGSPDAPQCGFSSQVVSLLNRLLPSYGSFDVLSDREVREGIKEFSSWPTIPQLYIGGEFQGGCDIVKEMYATGELHQALGLEAANIAPPRVTVTDAAVQLLRDAQARQGGDLHVSIDAGFKHSLSLAPRAGHEIAAESNGMTLLFDRDSAQRADGLTIDAVDQGGRKALAVDNPNAPKAGQVNQLSVQELRALLDAGAELRLYDVRTPEEHRKARIAGAELVDPSVAAEIEKLPRDARIVFHCHHGGRSQAAAEHFAALGFSNVHNLAGGIDAWSREIDPSVPRY
ncbi:MAG TPA: Grx4 family monothiol glutaredoxin [Myxococcota bacterium]|nr:Grx4 family monothiol glutaredoxin [Myxococcota bacterium]